MTNITTVGIDLAKNVFHIVACDRQGKVLLRKRLRRSQFVKNIANLPACLIGMEACGGAHHWARRFEAMGHVCKLVPAQYVKAFVRGNKNDYNDALAITEAIRQPQMRFVSIKTTGQQDIQALHRIRQQRIKERTALGNQMRGLLTEYGIIIPKGLPALRCHIPELLEAADNGLSPIFRQLLHQSYRQLIQLDEHIDHYTHLLTVQGQNDDACQRLQTIPGFGPINASVFASTIGDGKAFRRGRDVSASLGIVPRQHSTGGKPTLLGISKRGDRYLRSLLVHGARSVVTQAARKDDRLSRWINRIRAERGFNKAAVAMANKMARMGWAVLRHNTVYQAA